MKKLIALLLSAVMDGELPNEKEALMGAVRKGLF